MSKARLHLEDRLVPATPRWVKVFGAILIVFALLLAATHLTGNSPGGPGSHSQSNTHGGQQP
jgi:hypothetical protein